MRVPRYGDGRDYTGECLCHGNIVTGPVARGRPAPYMSYELFGGSVRCVLLISETGAHDVPLADLHSRQERGREHE